MYNLRVLSLSFLLILGACSSSVISGDFSKLSIIYDAFGENQEEFEIHDEEIINFFIDKINTSQREELDKVVFERGPDGKIVFQNNKEKIELQVFTDTGNVVTEQYYIKTNFDLQKYVSSNKQ